MFNQACLLDDAAIKINQVKTLIEILIEHRKTMPPYCIDNIIHIAFDILDEQENGLIVASSRLSGRGTGEQ